MLKWKALITNTTVGEYVDVEMYITMKYSYWYLIQRKLFWNVLNNAQFDI